MKTISKFALLVFILFFEGNLSAQFYTTKESDNILIFQEDESITSKFSTTRGTWEFRYINDKYFIIARDQFIQKNYNAIALYENFELKKFYSFNYNIRIDEIAHYQDEIVIPITEVDGSWNVLCKLNMKTDEISYIPLPESLRNLPNEKYRLKYFSFDEATSIAYLFYYSTDGSSFDPKQVISYNLKTGQFSKQASLEFNRYFCTLNSFHYYRDESKNIFSKKTDDPNSKPNKIALNGDRNYWNKISDSEIIVINEKKNKADNVLETDDSGYQVLKNGELVKDNKNLYLAMFNSITSKKKYNDFYFNYSESAGFLNKFSTHTPIHSYKILKPDLFLLIVLPNESNKIENNQSSSSTTSTIDDFEERIISFFGSTSSSFLLNTANDNWYTKCVEYEICKAERGADAFLYCKDLKNGLLSLGLDSKLNECEYLLNMLTGSRKEYYKITFGTSNYESLKNDLIKVKSTIIRVR